MRIKKYVAVSLPEAMGQVRQELGRDAVILHTQKVKVGGVFGLFSKTMVEVTAACDGASQRAPMEEAQAASFSLAPDIRILQDEINSMKGLMSQLVRRMEAPSELAAYPVSLRQLFSQMVAQGVREELATEIISEVSHDRTGDELDEESARRAVRTQVARRLGRVRPIEPAGRRQVIALVGPTGVGKTTTLAKLAAQFALGEKKSVALVTADTYRIAAVEQLRTYGEIIGVPVEVVFTPQELRLALGRHDHRDLVFIDTAGRGFRNAMQMSELKGLLEVTRADEIHLVLSLTTNLQDAEQVIHSFVPIGYNRLLMTKLDENTCPGQILNFAAAAGQPLSYVTTGQNVPDDMEVADTAKLAKVILGG